jgi:uncharacterized protein YndB with AHSA1/START domain
VTLNRTTFEPGPLAQVDCQPDDGLWTLVFVRELRHAPAKVWTALTDPTKLDQWAPYTADRDLGRVGEATLTMRGVETHTEIPVVVTRTEPPTLLEYTWGKDRLRWELAPTGEGTLLTLRHTITDPDSAPMMAAGWHLCLLVAERLLAGRPIAPIRGEDARNYGWAELHDAYAVRLATRDTP